MSILVCFTSFCVLLLFFDRLKWIV